MREYEKSREPDAGLPQGVLREAVDGLHIFRHAGITSWPQLSYGALTRRGGVSPPPFSSLNLSYNTPDSPENVDENLSRVRAAFGADKLFFSRQVHGERFFVINDLGCNKIDNSKVDATDANLRDISSLTSRYTSFPRSWPKSILLSVQS